MDQTVAVQDHKRLRVAEIAEELKVTTRTVYSLIDKEGWRKEVGRAGKVWYFVPVNFIEEYLAEALIDQSRSQPSLHTVSQSFNEPSQQGVQSDSQPISETSVTFTTDQFMMIIGDKDSRIEELKEQLAEKDRMLEDIRQKLEHFQNRVNRLEGEMTGRDNVLLERNRVIESLEKTIDAKDQSVNATQAAYLQLQEQYRQLENSKLPALETKSEVTEPAKQIEAKPTGWKWPWQK